jgi:transcriptional regulator with XRE-family HTH domain
VSTDLGQQVTAALRHISRAELARRAGLSRQDLSDLERGAPVFLSPALRQRLLQVLAEAQPKADEPDGDPWEMEAARRLAERNR